MPYIPEIQHIHCHQTFLTFSVFLHFSVFKRRIHGHEKDSGSSGSSYNMNQIVGNLQSESSPVLVQDNGTQTESYTETYRRRVATRDTDTRQTKRTKAKEGNKSWSPPWMRIIFFCLFNLFSYVTTKIYIDQTIEQGINRYLVDTMPNFALESQGARVLEDLSSDTYMGKENPSQICKKKLYWWCSNKKYRTVIQAKPFLNPGECWPFAGDQGHLVISLSHAVHISHVTLSHMAKSQCPHGTISSAPRRFSVYVSQIYSCHYPTYTEYIPHLHVDIHTMYNNILK
ncbi:uncharacterized protein LOC117828964 [Xyrichtys novacula]|uniref:Uncharacterized protein LOC117828964 n=1 Tax=Xyrichtys novacula TaxID=13765 RepID=A0AAV1EWI5_XYRNO|nr:uncharacterized protein LOC117828964 [Xyrichtys novacula]